LNEIFDEEVTQLNCDWVGPMRSVPPRGSGWVLEMN
jgi:hypothetical protein